MAAFSGTALALLKLAKLLKGAKLLSGVKGAIATKKAAGLGLSTAGKEYAKQQIAKQAAAQAGRMAGGNGFINGLGKAMNRAGYTGWDVVGNALPDVLMQAAFAGEMPGDAGDIGLSIATNAIVGQGSSAATRALFNVGRKRRQLDKIAKLSDQALETGKKLDPRIVKLRNKLQRDPMGAQALEYAGMIPGNYFGYKLGEEAQRAKSYVMGEGYLSPTDKMFVEQDEAMQAELLAAYKAGQSAGARGGYFYDPYTGDVPSGLDGVYYGY